jgi:uncharacterized protein
MQLVADKMLGRLARWLRIIGQDVAYGPELSGAGLLRTARQERRLILTRDRAVAKRNPPPYIMIQSDHFREQLKQVVDECGLDPLKDAFSRCAACNTALECIAKSAVAGKVPPYVYETQEKFSFCSKCRRVYWPATHQERILAELQSLRRK